MSDIQDLRVEPTPPVRPTAPVRPISRMRPVAVPDRQATSRDTHDANAAVTEGNLRAAYAQFVVNPDTHATVIRIHDAATGQVLSETPSPEVQQMTDTLKKYADTLARYRAAQHTGTAG